MTHVFILIMYAKLVLMTSIISVLMTYQIFVLVN